MVYKVVTAQINNDGTVTEGIKLQTIIHPVPLDVGGLYFLRPGKLYRIKERLEEQQ
jgi:hypothetical protein